MCGRLSRVYSMHQAESANYPADSLHKVVLSRVYSDNVFVGYQKKIVFKDGHYYEKCFNTKTQLISEKKFSSKEQLISAKLYKNHEIVVFIDTELDSSGNRHEVVLDKNDNIIAHHKFDSFNRFVGGGFYKNNKSIGHREIRYTEKGTFEKLYNQTTNTTTETKINPKKYLQKPSKNITYVVIEKHVISRKKNGAIYETVYDSNDQIISEPKLIQEPKQHTPQNYAMEPKHPAQTTNQSNINIPKNKMALLLRAIWKKLKIK